MQAKVGQHWIHTVRSNYFRGSELESLNLASGFKACHLEESKWACQQVTSCYRQILGTPMTYMKQIFAALCRKPCNPDGLHPLAKISISARDEKKIQSEPHRTYYLLICQLDNVTKNKQKEEDQRKESNSERALVLDWIYDDHAETG